MQFGQHKGKALVNVPDSYLLWLLRELQKASLYPGSFKAELLEYLEDNEDALKLNT